MTDYRESKDVTELADLEAELEKKKAKLDALKEAWKVENASLIIAVERLGEQVEAKREMIKTTYVVPYLQNGTKPEHPALGIRNNRALVGDPTKIEMWTRAFHPELLKYDPKEVLAFVRDEHDKGTTLPANFALLEATLTKVPIITIGGDLTAYRTESNPSQPKPDEEWEPPF